MSAVSGTGRMHVLTFDVRGWINKATVRFVTVFDKHGVDGYAATSACHKHAALPALLCITTHMLAPLHKLRADVCSLTGCVSVALLHNTAAAQSPAALRP